MPTADATLEKIRKILALAENPGATAAEAEAFTQKAARLMARHGIDEAMLERHRRHHRVHEHVFRVRAPYSRDRALFISHVALAMRCKAVIRPFEAHREVHVFGREVDVQSVELLVPSLFLQGARELSKTPVPRGENVAAFRRSWWAGFGAAVHGRIFVANTEAQAEAEREYASKEGTSVALVLADSSLEVEQAMRAHYPHLRQAGRRKLSGGGTRAGFVSGQNVDLGATALSS